jgi:DNA mismatch repair protein MutL
MSRIRILPEILSNKIAAGEVIERPASVVKELVENALDAGATRILIELKNAGKSLIRVADNGIGMNRDDSLLAVERYATSKLLTDADLFSIRTLGFRGEALPSIAAVSRLSVESRDKDSEAGARILVSGGRVQTVSEIGAPVGTQVSVQDLFFNTPARRKFMKSDATELGHIADGVARIALAWPGVMFRIDHNGKPLKNWPATEPEARISDVLGAQTRGALFPVRGASGALSIGGYAAGADVTRSTSQGIHLFVNHRFIRDRTIQHALVAGYGNRLMRGRFPVAALFITAPFEQVDVNVHPTKHEVRFADPRCLHHLVQTAIQTAVEASEKPKWTQPARQAPAVVAELPDGFENPGLTAPEETPAAAGAILPLPPTRPVAPGEPVPIAPERPSAPSQAHEQAPLWREGRFSGLRVIGQFRDTYILCESREKALILIDQHAAHERIRYEALCREGQDRPGESQRLLIPETVELGFDGARVLQGLLSDLDRLGIEIAPFGGNAFVITAAPSLLTGKPISPLILEIVEKTSQLGVSSGTDKTLDQLRKLMACHSAIRAKQRLADREIQALLEQLDHCEDPSHCPHGRPTWIRWELTEIEKSFRRIL